jgi:NADPH:quinone reductase-like Zn-dependent oxidoreductase
VNRCFLSTRRVIIEEATPIVGSALRKNLISANAMLMRAVVIDRYGGREVLQVREVPKPRPVAGEILVRVRACSINPVDWKIRNGLLKPLLPRSFPHILGSDIAGEVEEIGSEVAHFRAGDEVYAMVPATRGGGYAEYVAVSASHAARKPAPLSFEEAAAIPLAALTALQALRDKGKLKAGQSVLINGAAGGVGSFAVQIAKALGAKVTGVCGPDTNQLVLGLGANKVINYRNQDFTRTPERYDIVFDAVANRSFAECARIMTPRGRYVTTLPSASLVLWSAILPIANLVGYLKRARIILVRAGGRDLEFLKSLAENGQLRPVIDRVYSLEQIQEAHAYSESGHVHGKIVLRTIT